MRKALLLLLLNLVVALPPATAQTTPDPSAERARELFENGNLLYDEGRYEDAIVAWQEAYRLSERSVILFNIADAQEKLGRWQDALDTLSRYRAYAREDEREALDRRIRNLERRIQEQGPTAATTTAPPPVTTTTPPPAAPTTTMPVTPAPTGNERRGVRVLPLTLYGVGVAGLGAGAYFALAARGAREEAAGLCQDTDEGYLCPAEAEPALSRDARSSLFADIGFGVGGAAIIGGTLSLVLGGGTSASATLSPGGAAFSLSGSF